jgi:hypothetical protein
VSIFGPLSLSSLTTGMWFQILEEGIIHNLKNKLSSKNYRSRKRLNKVDVVVSIG